MNPLDDLLQTLPLPEGYSSEGQPEQEAAAYIAAQLLAADAPVAWLNGLADTLDTLAAATSGDAAHPDPLAAQYAALGPRIRADLPAWEAAIDGALRQQAQAYADLVPLGSQPEQYPRHWLKDQQAAHRARLLARFGEEAPPQAQLSAYRAALAQRQQAWQQATRLLAGIEGGPALRAQAMALATSTRQAMLAEARLQAEETQLPAQALALFETLLEGGSEQVLAIQWSGVAVPQAWIVAPQAWAANLKALPLLLWVHGEGGGLFFTDSLDDLRQKLTFTLGAGLPTALGPHGPEGEHDPAALVLAPSPGDTMAAIQRLIEQWAQHLDQAGVAMSDAGQDPAYALQRALDEARAALAVPVDATRQLALAAVERQWQADALVTHMPRWLLARGEDERKAVAVQLETYHLAAAELEYWLSEQVPEFSRFAGDLLAGRIQRDLGLVIAPDAPVLTRPVSVTYHWFGPGTVLEPPPGLGYAPPLDPAPAEGGQQWVASEAWETVSLARLAVENLDAEDEAEVERLKMGRWHLAGLSAAYLMRTLPDLDPLNHYEARLREVLDPDLAQAPERLRRPYELELTLQAQMEHWQHRLSAEGLAMVRTAASTHDPAALAEQGMQVYWLVVNTGEALRRHIEGCCALTGAGGRTLLCLPGAPERYALLERDTLESAVDALREGIRLQPAVAEYVAQRLGDEPLRLLSYFRQAAAHGYTGYLNASPSLGQTLVAIQLHDRRAWLRGLAAHEGRSQHSILQARHLMAHQRHLGYLRAALAVLPGVGHLVALEDLYDSSRAAAAAWHQQDAQALGLAALGVAGGLVDILLSTLPVAGSLVALRRAIRTQVRTRSGLRARRAPLAGYEAALRLRGATPLEGRDAGSWLAEGRHYIWQDGQAYAVYRRAGEDTLRLRATATRRYEAPVRRDGQRWVIHAQVGLRGGGGKLTDAEQTFATWGPGSVHAPFAFATRQQALQRGRRLLEQYRFPDADRANEFAHAYLVEGTPPAWALQYRTGAGTAPVIPSAPDRWQQVRWNLDEAERILPGPLGGEVDVGFRHSDQLQPGLRWEGQYYPLLRNAPVGQERFIVPAGEMPGNLQDLDELIRQGSGPVRVRLGQTRTEPPQLLGGFTETFDGRLARRFPRLSPVSRQALGEALYRRADPAVTGLTQRRLQALERFIDSARSDPLEALSVRLVQGLEVPLNLSDAPGRYQQLRWLLDASEDAQLRLALGYDGIPELRTQLGQIIGRRGYEVLFDHAVAERYMAIFRRPGQPFVYVLAQRTSLGGFPLQGNNGITLLSPPWLDMLITRVTNPRLAALLRRAHGENRLRPIIGGLALPGGRNGAELVWERVDLSAAAGAPVQVRNWRHTTRPFQPGDIETAPGSGLYLAEGDTRVQGARVQGRWLPLIPAEDGTQVMLSRPSGVPSPLTFEALERCVRERFGEQPWLVIREGREWRVRRHLFLAPLDRQVGRARPGLTRESALNVARSVFERPQGSEHARLLHLEHVLSSWMRNSQPLGELADPALMLTRQHPTLLPGGAGWQLPVPADLPAASVDVLYLRPVEQYTQNLVAAMSRPRMRHHAPNVIDDMLVRYGWVLDHRAGNIAQYRQPSSGRLYLVSLQVSEQPVTQVAQEAGLQVLSNDWINHWQARLGPAHAAALRQATDQGSLVRLVATLRLGGPLNGQVALQRLADF